MPNTNTTQVRKTTDAGTDPGILWLEYDGRRYASEASRALDGITKSGTPHAMALDTRGDLAVTMNGAAVATLVLDKNDTIVRSEVRFAPIGISARRIKTALDAFLGRKVLYRAL